VEALEQRQLLAAPEISSVYFLGEPVAGDETTLHIVFHDPDPEQSYWAYVDWGDQQSDPDLTPYEQGGMWYLDATHTYAAGGTYYGSFTIYDSGEESVQAAFTAQVTDVPRISGVGTSAEQQLYTLSLAFDNPYVAGWYIYWGDGTNDYVENNPSE